MESDPIRALRCVVHLMYLNNNSIFRRDQGGVTKKETPDLTLKSMKTIILENVTVIDTKIIVLPFELKSDYSSKNISPRTLCQKRPQKRNSL